MRVRLLGTAAGGGFPQWNCGCPNCRGVREKAIDAEPRTQASCAVSLDGRRWFLLHASPDVRAQIESFPPLWPTAGRASPIAGVLLANGDLDACLGLLMMRESTSFSVWGTSQVLDDFRGCTMAKTLQRRPDQVTFCALEPGRAVALADGLIVEAVPVPGKPPLHLAEARPGSPLDNAALVLSDGKTRVVWAPTVAEPTAALEQAVRSADAVLFDGTFFTDGELAELGLSTRTARQMAHLPVSESLPWLAAAPGRRILVHLNNTNPLLRADSEARKRVSEAGIEIGFDGMEVFP